MNKTKMIAFKRISKDIQEITKNPVEGIGIIQYENDFLKYIVNIQLMSGIYKGFCLQLLLTFSESYPTKPPKILIFPGQNFDGRYHHHVFSDVNGFYKFCFDLLDNDFMKTDEENTGWNPSYTISSLLIQVQNFLCDPDLHHEVPKYLITQFFESMKNYKKIFKDDEGNDITHTWDAPYPPMFFKSEAEKKSENSEDNKKENSEEEEDIKDNNDIKNDDIDKFGTEAEILKELEKIKKDKEQGIKIDKKRKKKLRKKLNELKYEEEQKPIIKKKEEEQKKLIEIKENLTCFMLKLNYIEDPEILLGYPIIQKQAGKGLKIKIELYPIPELLTYDGFIAQIGKKDEKLDFYFDISFKSANNEFYNYWVPIYIDKNHFEKNKDTILNSFSVIKFGAMGIKEYDFKAEYIFEILPIILNKMIIGIFNKKTSLSEAFIRCYFQYILLLKKLTEIYKKEFDEYLSNILTNIKNNRNHIDKRIIPDIGNFLVLLLFSNFEISDDLMKCLIDESSIRQMYWMFHSEENVNEVKKILIESSDIDNSRLEKTTEDKIKDIARKTKKGELKIENIEEFKNYLVQEAIFEQICDLILKDKNIYKFPEFKKPQKNQNINNNNTEAQKNPFNELNIDTTNIENEDALEQNFDSKINDYLKELDEDILYDIFKLVIDKSDHSNMEKFYSEDKMKEIEKSEYERGFVDNILKDINDENIKKKLLTQFFENQKGNKLTLISFLARKKIKTPGFMEELEKNYGVLLNCSDFLKEIKTIFEQVKSYKELYKFIGVDLIGDYNEFYYIIKTYRIAKKKRYIRAIYGDDFPKFERKKYYNKEKDYNDYENYDNNYNYNNDYEEESEDKEEDEKWETVGKKSKKGNNEDNNNYYYNNNSNSNYRGRGFKNNYRGGRGGRGRRGDRGGRGRGANRGYRGYK